MLCFLKSNLFTAISFVIILFVNSASFAQDNFPNYLDKKNIYNETNLIIPVTNVVLYNKVVMLEAPTMLHPGKNTFVSQGYDGREDHQYSLFRYSILIGSPQNPKGQCKGTNLFIYGMTLEDCDGSNGFHCHQISDGDQNEKIKSLITKN